MRVEMDLIKELGLDIENETKIASNPKDIKDLGLDDLIGMFDNDKIASDAGFENKPTSNTDVLTVNDVVEFAELVKQAGVLNTVGSRVSKGAKNILGRAGSGAGKVYEVLTGPGTSKGTLAHGIRSAGSKARNAYRAVTGKASNVKQRIRKIVDKIKRRNKSAARVAPTTAPAVAPVAPTAAPAAAPVAPTTAPSENKSFIDRVKEHVKAHPVAYTAGGAGAAGLGGLGLGVGMGSRTRPKKDSRKSKTR
jgi:hypothetical protein